MNLHDEMNHFFSENGQLSKSESFEFRPEQQELACAVAQSLEKEKSLVTEAGTGVGKSLAYLVPAILYGIREGKKVVISTHTINLQGQLVDKDLPLAKHLLADEVDFTYSLLKGRQNYICPKRLKAAMSQKVDLFTKPENEELHAIWDWAQETKDGSKADLDFQPSLGVWSQVCSEPHLCTLRHCGPQGTCFFQEARKRAGEAAVVVVNHTLFFSLLDPEGIEQGFLFPNDFLIFDEAHTLEQVAATQLGLRVSEGGLRFEMNRLYNLRSRKGLLKSLQSTQAIKAVEKVSKEADAFFKLIERAVNFKEGVRECRVREPDLVENTLAAPLKNLCSEIESAAEKVENETTRIELLDAARRTREIYNTVSLFLSQEDEESVYWLQRSGADMSSISLHATPVNIADRLRPLLFESGRSVIATSATLGDEKDNLLYFRSRIGAEAVPALKIGSPFNYSKQMKILVAKGMPDPMNHRYEAEMARWIQNLVEQSQGRAFVLFTSYRILSAMAETLRHGFEQSGWPLLVQGEGMSRQRMIEKFRSHGKSVLFGTDSFWTGVDVPGKALSNVIITRLPFAVPDHPVTAARLEQLESMGKNPFMEYSLPEAVLKLRQGVGRLIRSKKDCGTVAILDNRILTRRYGTVFLNALPNAPVTILDHPPTKDE